MTEGEPTGSRASSQDEFTAVPVLNATGVVDHARLGRAPLSAAVLEQLAAVAYADFESCREGLEAHLCALTGAEAAFAVNNGAAALLLAMASTAAGREVVVSRGELVESDGARVAELIEQSGCRLVEVGSTNRTRLSDYEEALGAEVGALLKVQPSAFSMAGDVESASVEELARRGVPLIVASIAGDLEAVRESIAAGASLVTFSGDRRPGGPQAGLLVGRAAAVQAARRHPLSRVLRLDKLRLVALEQTLALWRAGRMNEVPAARMLAESIEVIGGRASMIAACIGEEAVVSELDDGASVGVVVRHPRADELADLLRIGTPVVWARRAPGAVLLDARTLFDRDVMPVATAVRQALASLARQAGEPLTLLSSGDQATAESSG